MPQILFLAFLMLMFVPCVAAMLGLRFDQLALGNLDLQFAPPRALGAAGLPLCALGDGRPVAEEFEIRSFPKGLSVKRNLLRDGVAAMVEIAEKVIAAPTVAIAVQHVAAAVATPISNRRGLMMQMVADKAEVEVWLARAANARGRLRAIEESDDPGTDALRLQLITLAEQLWAAEQGASAAAQKAQQRIAKAEAMLQRRADLEMTRLTPIEEFAAIRASGRHARAA